ncbi:unnamed protein product, partial [Amoebophrya sp. A25]|eukprot:GSA25T00005579001.1
MKSNDNDPLGEKIFIEDNVVLALSLSTTIMAIWM